MEYTNDPVVIAREPRFNATVEVGFPGRASEGLGSQYWSSSGQAGDSVSRIVPQLHPGAAVRSPSPTPTTGTS